MPCNKCGAATKTIQSDGGTKSGAFREIVECANGHRGTVTGDASNSPEQWTKYGEVFQE